MRSFRTALGLTLAALFLGTWPAAAQEAGLLVKAAWLHSHLGDAKVRIVDMTTDRQEYVRGHVPGAVYLGVDDERIAVPSGGFRLPTQREAAKLLGGLGIGPETHVVIYDEAGDLNASRLYFTLDVLGYSKVSLLDGGIQAWRRAGFPLSTEVPKVAPTAYQPRPRPERAVSAEWVTKHVKDPTVVVLDTRTAGEYAGTDVRAKRGGHVPGAVHVDWRQNIGSDMAFKPVAELRAMYLAKGVTPEKTVVTYCQTHHRASNTYFVLRLLGYKRVAGYDRSWSEWGNRTDLAIEK